MRIEGRRIHIAGSADRDTPEQLLRYAHELVDHLVQELSKQGATFIISVGKEPLSQPDNPSSPAIIFDWTALAAAHKSMQDGIALTRGVQGRLITTVVTSKTERQIPEYRRYIWNELRTANAVKLVFIEPGWASGGLRRIRQTQLGDMLIALSGGEGVEHLAQEYAAAGKPVIPLDLDLGSSRGDGSGGAARLAREALAHPERFGCHPDPDAAGDLLARLATHQGKVVTTDVVKAVIDVIHALESPTVFYVRLLNSALPEFGSVERFFRNVLDPVVKKFGYKAVEMGREASTYAWMNEAIFDSLHYSSVVVVDLTGLRNNCFMEFGYALGHGNRVLLTAQKGTYLPFDSFALDCNYWEDSANDDERIRQLEEYWQRTIDRPPIVKPRSIL